MSVEFDYREGFVVYPDESSGPDGRKAPYVDHGTARIPPERFFSLEEADLEWQHMWRKVWSFAGLMQDIPEVGDYLKFDLGKESFIVVRKGSGTDEIAAYYNVCPHRGNQIVRKDFGHARDGNFYCDFHGWKWDLDGLNIKVRDPEIFREETLQFNRCLVPVRCEAWNSLIFVNMDPDAAPLVDYLDVIPHHLRNYPFDRYRVLRDLNFEWEANWKTAMDAFMEFYHADDVHPQVLPLSATLEVQYDLYKNGMSRMIIPLGFVTRRFDDRDTVNDALKAFVSIYGGNPADYADLKGYEYKKALVDVKRKWGKKHGYDFFDDLTDDQIADDWNYFTFPNMTLNVFADSVLLQIFRPHPTDPNRSFYHVITLCLPVKDKDTPVLDPNSFGPETFGPKGWDGSVRPPRVVPTRPEELGNVLEQDAARVPSVQVGLRSEAFKGYILSESECRIRHYLAEIDRYIGR